MLIYKYLLKAGCWIREGRTAEFWSKLPHVAHIKILGPCLVTAGTLAMLHGSALPLPIYDYPQFPFLNAIPPAESYTAFAPPEFPEEGGIYYPPGGFDSAPIFPADFGSGGGFGDSPSLFGGAPGYPFGGNSPGIIPISTIVPHTTIIPTIIPETPPIIIPETPPNLPPNSPPNSSPNSPTPPVIVTPVSEPSSIWLILPGLIGLFGLFWWQKGKPSTE